MAVRDTYTFLLPNCISICKVFYSALMYVFCCD
uniref:Uncharacterized protein n=1 Tax=Anguilla anguilla TaxID=7936 RepID=A0A0E9SJD8_ANGAN